MAVKPIPEGYHTVTPYLIVEQADDVIKFLKEAFDAKEVFEAMRGPDGKLSHAELLIGNSHVMLSEACPEKGKGKSTLYLYVEDVDKVYEKAIKAGGKEIRKPENQFYGDRSGGVTDVSGNEWWISTHVEDVSGPELEKRMKEAMKEKAAAK